nr:hypothetical protein [Anaerolineae bacterium]
MKQNNTLGAVLAIIGALLGIFGMFIIFTQWYEPMMAAEVAAGRPDEETIVKFIIPALNDFGIIAGVLWAVAAYGFLSKARWGWPVAVVANVLALQGSFFPMIPAASRGLPPMFGIVFVPNLILYVLLLWLVGRVNWKVLVFSLFSGMAFVLAFMNGVASTDRIIVIGTPLYVAVQRLNWIASIGWGVFTIWLILKPAEWVRVVGLAAGLLAVVAGTPLGMATTLSFGHFSMFFPAPMLSLVLIIILLLPWGKKLLQPGEPA